MRVGDWFNQATEKLQAAGIGTARLDALVLLEDATSRDRGWLLAHPEVELQRSQIQKLSKQITQRASHEPLAYVRKKTEFYGREFYIDHCVLEPRPESETMIELLKVILSENEGSQNKILRATQNDGLLIIDIGTGSGALAITAKLELPKVRVIGTDIDKKCLAVASRNAKLLKADVEFIEGDLLEPLMNEERRTKNDEIFSSVPHSPFSILLCNLPYVPDGFRINPAAMAEPRIAIFGGPDGLDIYRKFFKQLRDFRLSPSLIFTESMPPQHQKLASIAKSAGYRLLKTDDFIQVFES